MLKYKYQLYLLYICTNFIFHLLYCVCVCRCWSVSTNLGRHRAGFSTGGQIKNIKYFATKTKLKMLFNKIIKFVLKLFIWGIGVQKVWIIPPKVLWSLFKLSPRSPTWTLLSGIFSALCVWKWIGSFEIRSDDTLWYDTYDNFFVWLDNGQSCPILLPKLIFQK